MVPDPNGKSINNYFGVKHASSTKWQLSRSSKIYSDISSPVRGVRNILKVLRIILKFSRLTS
jgi:hypothetical protein